MVKINKRWAIVVAIVFIAACVACSVFAIGKTKKAKAQEGSYESYTTGYYVVPMAVKTGGSRSSTNWLCNVSMYVQFTLTNKENGIEVYISVAGFGGAALSAGEYSETDIGGNLETYLHTVRNGAEYIVTTIEDDSELSPVYEPSTHTGYVAAKQNTRGVPKIQNLSNCIISVGGTWTTPLSMYTATFCFGSDTSNMIAVSFPTTAVLMSGTFLENRPEGSNLDFQGNYQAGYQNGVQSQQPIINSARKEGYNSGYAAGAQQTSSLGNILLGIGGVPFETLQSIFDFDLLGINISSLVMSILTAAIAIWIVKLFI
jgi:uncharacterized membrane protein YeaQ/YmgE (transglycosylase-associated protein family)|nr:MAG TPA: hypothetical protein [Inoviridae sp.]